MDGSNKIWHGEKQSNPWAGHIPNLSGRRPHLRAYVFFYGPCYNVFMYLSLEALHAWFKLHCKGWALYRQFFLLLSEISCLAHPFWSSMLKVGWVGFYPHPPFLVNPHHQLLDALSLVHSPMSYEASRPDSLSVDWFCNQILIKSIHSCWPFL